MDFQEVVRKRRMVRTFREDPVPDELMERLLDNATRGPSAGFSQGQAFLVLRGEELRVFWQLVPETTTETVRRAPLVIVPLSSKDVYLDRYALPDKGWTDRAEDRWPVPFWHIDTGMAALLILQTAVDLGLGALFFGIYPGAVDKFRETFAVPADHEPIGAIAVGYPDEPKARDLSSRRRDKAQVIHYGRW
ncbi:nitroreductase family protein [Pseudonocardiaceae bacterium YIM PH 21723]|nr:nitroreductase family protein [Pseudonocardiaceae bacterium YIM PH 21723]